MHASPPGKGGSAKWLNFSR